MKKWCKIFRNVLTLVLTVALISGSSVMTASAAARTGCSHPRQILTIGNRPEKASHLIPLYYADGSFAGRTYCTITRIYQAKISTCATCGLVVSETNIALLSESHSEAHP